MNLKNRLFGKIFSSMLLSAAVLQSCSPGTAYNSRSNAVAEGAAKALPATFVSDSLGRVRDAYFKANKDAILRSSNFYFDSVGNVQSTLQGLLHSGNGSITGLRIYIAETKDSNIALIFSPTVKTAKGDYTDSGQYQILTQGAGVLVPMDSAAAEQYVTRYRTDKKRKLDSTLTSALNDRDLGETTSLLYDSAQINDMCREMEYQNTYNKDAISGMWIIVTAHTDRDTAFPQRLNLEFAFAGKDAGNSPVSIENINRDDFNKRLNTVSGRKTESENYTNLQNLTEASLAVGNAKVVGAVATATASNALASAAASGTGAGGMDTGIPCPADCNDGSSL